MKIALDFDGTLARTMDRVCELINEKEGTSLTYKNITDWSWLQDNGFKDQFWWAYDQLDKHGRKEIKFYDQHTKDALYHLWKKYPWTTHILTCNNKEAGESISDWLFRTDSPPFPILCLGRTTCHEKLARDYDVYVDDNPNMAVEMKNFPKKFLYLARAPWNRSIMESENVVPFESWKELENLL